jgi:hypothetical protein
MVRTAGRGGKHSRGKRYNKMQNARTTRANAEQARAGRATWYFVSNCFELLDPRLNMRSISDVNQAI